MDKLVADSVNSLLEKIRATDIFVTYTNQVRMIQKYPNIMQQINEYREENFFLQNRYSGDELYDKLEEFDRKYEKFLENPLVDDYLAAESALCRMMQEVNTNIIEGLDFL